MTQCWQLEKGLLEKQIARVQSYTSCPQKLLLSGIMARVRSPEREEQRRFQLLADMFLEPALVKKKQEKKKTSVLPLSKGMCVG